MNSSIPVEVALLLGSSIVDRWLLGDLQNIVSACGLDLFGIYSSIVDESSVRQLAGRPAVLPDSYGPLRAAGRGSTAPGRQSTPGTGAHPSHRRERAQLINCSFSRRVYSAGGHRVDS